MTFRLADNPTDPAGNSPERQVNSLIVERRQDRVRGENIIVAAMIKQYPENQLSSYEYTVQTATAPTQAQQDTLNVNFIAERAFEATVSAGDEGAGNPSQGLTVSSAQAQVERALQLHPQDV